MDPVSDQPVDDSLCRNCGKCCYKKVFVGRAVFITPFPCKHLDVDTNLCTVYHQRKTVNPECLSVPEGMQVSAFPADCPYVPRHAPRNYRPARDDWVWGSDWKTFDDLAKELEVAPELVERIRVRGPDAPPIYIDTFERLQRERLQRYLAGNNASAAGVSSDMKAPPSAEKP